MSRDRDLDLDAILAEFHGQEEKARPVNRPEAPKTMSRRELREEAERQTAAQKRVPTEEKTLLFQSLPAEKTAPRPEEKQKVPTPEREELPTEEPRRKTPAPTRKAAEKPAKAPVRKQTKKEQRPGLAFALMFMVLLVLAAALAGLMRWSSLAEEAAQPQPPEEIRLNLGEDLEALLNEEAASSR